MTRSVNMERMGTLNRYQCVRMNPKATIKVYYILADGIESALLWMKSEFLADVVNGHGFCVTLYPE